MKYIATFLFIIAVFTGRSEMFTTVTGKQAIRCEYQAPETGKFWRSFYGLSCPPSINVE